MQVSRQSVSKWENNNATPDLDKLVKLSELFGVTMDELVTGTPQTANPQTVLREGSPAQQGLPPRKLVGALLLCMALLITVLLLALGGGWLGLVLSIPLLVCGLICFLFKKHVGLWCAWAVYLCVDIALIYATGVSRGAILHTFHWTAQMNYAVLVVAWLWFLCLVSLVLVTVYRFRKIPIAASKKGRWQLVFAWMAFVLLQAVAMLLPYTAFFQSVLANIQALGWYQLAVTILAWARILAVTVALVITVRFIYTKKHS